MATEELIRAVRRIGSKVLKNQIGLWLGFEKGEVYKEFGSRDPDKVSGSQPELSLILRGAGPRQPILGSLLPTLGEEGPSIHVKMIESKLLYRAPIWAEDLMAFWRSFLLIAIRILYREDTVSSMGLRREFLQSSLCLSSKLLGVETCTTALGVGMGTGTLRRHPL
ncbi:unnamed protein product [Heterotrigona itama]|uniref:Uncharacterized protein n=1 Tax=Heterotrigona itama TaxID=395501 RepID=A0A6V7HJI2_9HYME|nr:unnamed protein product [Heterotrigona itama]